MTLAGTDNAGGSGIDKTEYKVDGGAFATYSAPIVVSTAGTHTIEYRSTDKNGNVEATKTLSVKVDKVAPATTAALAPAAPGPGGTYKARWRSRSPRPMPPPAWPRPSTRSTPRARSAPSVRPSWRRAAAEYVTYDPANKPSFTAPGAYSIDYRSADAAGNVETAKTVDFTIGLQQRHAAPVTTGTLDPAAPGAGRTYSGPVTVKFSANDPGAGGPAAKTVKSTPPATSGFRTRAR